MRVQNPPVASVRKRRGITVYEYHLRPRETARPAHVSYHHDEEIMQALVTAGAMVAIADGFVAPVERDELVDFISRERFVPSISPGRIATVFEARVRELDDRNAPDIIVNNFRPLAGRSLGSLVARVAQHVAAADGKLNTGELQSMKLIELMLAETSLSRGRGGCRALRPTATSTPQLQIVPATPPKLAIRDTEFPPVRVVRKFLRTALPLGAIGLALLASAAWTTFLVDWAFRAMRWTLTSLLL